MVWDYAECNPLCASTGNWMAMVDWAWKALETTPAAFLGYAAQADAQNQTLSADKVVSSDPPYYDNIGYADLSDFFYVWLRRSLKPVFPDLFATLEVPKAQELVATPYRHGSKKEAEAFFLVGMSKAVWNLCEQAHPAFPVTIYYAFKQAETRSEERGEERREEEKRGEEGKRKEEGNESDGLSSSSSLFSHSSFLSPTSTGWETFLDAVISAGYGITGTWPMRTEMQTRQISMGTNALASSIVLVCRKRPEDAPTATRREFVAALKAELPGALRYLQAGNIAPVDLAQAAIGPGMGVFTRYGKVLDAQGATLPVREALALINQVLDEALAEQEGDFDADSRWALAWFEQYGFGEGEYGVAETLSKAKNTSVAGLVEAGILESKRGRVCLLRPEELSADWDPATDKRLSAWEVVHHLIRVLASGGESAAAALVAPLGAKAETARELAYRLYTLCERKKRATEALAYNGLVQSWPEILRLAKGTPKAGKEEDLFK